MEQRYQDILRIFKRKVKDGEKAIALDMIGCIKSLPSADRPSGEWAHRNSYWHTAICSNCNKVTMFEEWDEEVKEYDFCPNCGARMKGADDE